MKIAFAGLAAALHAAHPVSCLVSRCERLFHMTDRWPAHARQGFTAYGTGGTIYHVATASPEAAVMAHTIWGSAPRNNCNCSRNGAPRGGSPGLWATAVVLALIACLGLAACTSSQGVSGQAPARSAQGGPRITVAMVTHGQAF